MKGAAAAFLAGACLYAGPAPAQPERARSLLPEGKVVAISDGDFTAQTYATGTLNPNTEERDLLTILSTTNGRTRQSTLPISNSVTAAPEILALTADGTTAFVVERLGARSATARSVTDLPPGERLFAIDLRNPAHPHIVDTARIAPYPEALALSPEGRRIAIVSNTPRASLLHILDYEDSRFGSVLRIDLGTFVASRDGDAPRRVTATNVQWHPSGRILAVNLNSLDEVLFLALDTDEPGSTIRAWGDPVRVGRDPFVGRFTPDGRYYLTSNWGRDLAAKNLEGRLPSRSSTVSVVRLADLDDTRPENLHLGEVETGMSAEGLAISPDGRLIATVNMGGTAFLPESPRFQRNASVSLLRFDAGTGALLKVADYPLDGALPEGGSFDAAGDHFMATVFQGHSDESPSPGAHIALFRVVRRPTPSFELVDRFSVAHGVHHVAVAP